MLRFAVLGPPRVGKSAFVYRLATNCFLETHYPTADPASVLVCAAADVQAELVDTRPFDVETVVPFLSRSLNTDQTKAYFGDPGPVGRAGSIATPLLIGSGLGTLNARIDGYFFLYSAAPSASEDPLLQLQYLRSSIRDAWISYFEYQDDKLRTQESDIYSFIGGIKSLWRDQNLNQNQKDSILNKSAKILKSEKITESHLSSSQEDPKNYDSNNLTSTDILPPIIIIVTHVNHQNANQLLINKGETFANKYGHEFIKIDNLTGLNIDYALQKMIDIQQNRNKIKNLKLKFNLNK